jgi:hypothetical protein
MDNHFGAHNSETRPEPYGRSFYEDIRNGSKRSARIVAPIVIEITKPQSIIDVGCGDGTWLAAFRELGVTDLLGVDGEYVDRDMLQIPPSLFRPVDLSTRFHISRRFDLALSLEVAEHLPAQSAAGFVESLTRLAPLVLFSAAIPFQGGTRHVNEQWPEYWAALFGTLGYYPIDCIREKIWHNQNVEFWYVQNSLLFAERNAMQSSPRLQHAFEATNPHLLSKVHPRGYLQATKPLVSVPGLLEATGILRKAAKNALSKRVIHPRD